MDQETLRKLITNLSKSDFDGVVSLILNRIYNLNAVDVDGPGDGGSDFRVLADVTGGKVVSVQKTVQESKWENKAFKDAQKAKNIFGAKRYIFITSKSPSAKKCIEVEDKIFTQLGLPARVIGAKEIAGLVLENELLSEFARAINLQLEYNKQKNPDTRERLLYTYFSLSDDKVSMQHEIYEGALLYIISQKNAFFSRPELLDAGMKFLDLQESKRVRLNGRIDALLTAGKIVQKDGKIFLDSKAASTLEITNGIYLKELKKLSGAQADLIEAHGGSWDMN